MRSANPLGRRGWAKAAGPVSPRRMVPCPKCEAEAGDRCWKMSSWVSTGPGGAGFYTERTESFHNERKAPTVEKTDDGPTRGSVRREISSLAHRKLSGTDRMRVRNWANSTRRTLDELVAKRDELARQGDVI